MIEQTTFEVRIAYEGETTFMVDARTSEEAETIAEQDFRDGDKGFVLHEEVISSEALPANEDWRADGTGC